MARVTITKVAEEAGVSIGTASLVLNGRAKEKRLSDECIERVQAAASQLGYLGNYHARTLARGKSMTLGFITKYNQRDMSRPAIESGIAAEANARGYEVLTLSLPDGHGTIRRAAQYVEQGRIDGFAVFMGGWSNSPVAEHIPPPIPMTHIWYSPDGFKPVVTFNPAPGIHQAVRHLADQGHRRVVWLGIETEFGIELPERLEAFRKAAHKAGIDPVEHFLSMEPREGEPGNRTVSRFHQELCNRLDILADATAVICFNDAMATGLSIALREKNRRVPHDISLVGFDDTQAIYAAPPLTTISHSFMEMGRAAVRYLDALIENGEDRTEEQIRVPSRLVVRESTAPPKKSSR